MLGCKMTFEILFEAEDSPAKLAAESHIGRFGWIGSHRVRGLPPVIYWTFFTSDKARPLRACPSASSVGAKRRPLTL
jgi:hypothetical protein